MVQKSFMQSGALIHGIHLSKSHYLTGYVLRCHPLVAPPWKNGTRKCSSKKQKAILIFNISSDSRLTTTIVPIIVVYTKFDLRAERLDEDGKEFTERSFKEKYGQKVERRVRHSTTHQIPYTVVTSIFILIALVFK